MAIINNQGDIIILDSDGMQTYIGTLKHGISYSTKAKARKVARVTIQPTNGFLTDEFFFCPGEKNYELIFQHLMNRDTNPELLKTYLMFFADQENYSPMEFISYVIKNYFVKELGCQFPDEKQESN